jgi:hydrogenase-4 component F
MISGALCIGSLFVAPLLGVCAGALPVGSRGVLRAGAGAAAMQCGIVAFLYRAAGRDHRIFAFGNNLFLDSLSYYHLGLVALVFFLSSVYANSYFSEEIEQGTFGPKRARRFGLLWNGFFAVLTAVLCANNLGILWICLEATTLISALLILTRGNSASIEAMWKYLLLCSVGIAFAFVGTLLLSVAARAAHVPPGESLLWTSLADRNGMLDGRVMCVAFIFILVGFGTKAGLAPMHTWLPDAHSQAPTPVSAVFSGVMLNCALYCIMRYLPLCEASMGLRGRPHAMLVVFGLLSIMVAAVFIPSQKNIKRLLAYHSVEHMGIIALGLGFGGLGTFAALFHTLNHSVSKTLAFFSAGRLARHYGTHDMAAMKGAVGRNPLWGPAFFVAILALIGVAPFSVFMSEFQIVKASVDGGKYAALAVFLFGSVVVFVSALRHAIDVCMGKRGPVTEPARWFPRDFALVIACVGLLLACGFHLPAWYVDLLRNASAIVEGTQAVSGFAGGLFQ